ncbi:MAG: nuclear transport factor 2 family protein [Nitrospirales bacterium]|nr:nuclear transport factor 2 family protein [Nitrospirales bacterium]
MGRRIHWRRTLVEKVAPAHPQTPFISRCETHMKPSVIVRAWMEALNRADVEALANFYAEDAVNHHVANELVVGRAAIRRMFAEEFARAEMRCIVGRIFEIDDWAILEWRDSLGLRRCGFF